MSPLLVRTLVPAGGLTIKASSTPGRLSESHPHGSCQGQGLDTEIRARLGRYNAVTAPVQN